MVGLPGDRIQVRQGQLMLNDRPVTRAARARARRHRLRCGWQLQGQAVARDAAERRVLCDL
ncbi:MULTISPECIES: S26 family signal peptidase [unclassified Bradyrhizobium]|uniref:S26 family signal peptidase n=1 Tax=unclassified Bradyrhizobium TaxID=2631580 RepID=UPI002096A48F|nr:MULTISPECIES: S26 family signal peptidase [unclassified Bradyrhizobium]